jgi:hypothetical protein
MTKILNRKQRIILFFIFIFIDMCLILSTIFFHKNFPEKNLLPFIVLANLLTSTTSTYAFILVFDAIFGAD